MKLGVFAMIPQLCSVGEKRASRDERDPRAESRQDAGKTAGQGSSTEGQGTVKTAVSTCLSLITCKSTNYALHKYRIS